VQRLPREIKELRGRYAGQISGNFAHDALIRLAMMRLRKRSAGITLRIPGEVRSAVVLEKGRQYVGRGVGIWGRSYE